MLSFTFFQPFYLGGEKEHNDYPGPINICGKASNFIFQPANIESKMVSKFFIRWVGWSMFIAKRASWLLTFQAATENGPS